MSEVVDSKEQGEDFLFVVEEQGQDERLDRVKDARDDHGDGQAEDAARDGAGREIPGRRGGGFLEFGCGGWRFHGHAPYSRRPLRGIGIHATGNSTELC